MSINNSEVRKKIRPGTAGVRRQEQSINISIPILGEKK